MKRRRSDVPSEIPTASMSDVAFLLICFFLLASAHSTTRGIRFTIPAKEPQPLTAEADPAVLIRIAPDGSLTVDGRPLPLGGLAGYLDPKLRRNPAKPVIVQTALAARYAAMTDVLDELRLAGVGNVVIPTSGELALYGLSAEE